MAQGRVQRAASKVDFKSLALAERLMTRGLRKKDKRNNSRFYDIELISKEPQVIDSVLKKKVHYVGYSHGFEIIKLFPKRATIYTTDEGSLSDLFHDDFWFHRILNEAGDIAQINMNTLQLLCTCKKSIKEYVEKDGKLVLNEIESGLNLKLQFVIEHNKCLL